MIMGYWYFAAYYRVSARELKRLGKPSQTPIRKGLLIISLDGNLRSLLYGHFTESLSGLPTIRAYGSVDQFIRDNDYFIDLEDRALFLTCSTFPFSSIFPASAQRPHSKPKMASNPPRLHGCPPRLRGSLALCDRCEWHQPGSDWSRLGVSFFSVNFSLCPTDGISGGAQTSPSPLAS